ncbi:MAG TPA: tetratricopeptide repeat protein [Bryobacteraceae bacterium]|nr:tetratricopeptide repeat protein [Bryobacteraceae bacterium]
MRKERSALAAGERPAAGALLYMCSKSCGHSFLLFLAVAAVAITAGCERNPQIRKQKFYNRGMELLQTGNVKKATLELMNALKIDPNFAEAASVLAELDFRQGDYRQAYGLLLQAESAKPDYLPPHKGLAQIYRLSGKLADAERETNYILQRSPDDIEALLNLGAVQTKQKKYQEAQGTFNRILELHPGNVSAFLALASMKKDAGDNAAAERYLKLALEQNPRSVAVYLALLKLDIVAGRSAEVEPLFVQALRISGNNVEILDAQLGYYLGARKFAEAERVARQIQSSRAKDPSHWSALADFYVQTNQWAKADGELNRLLQVHKGDIALLHKVIEVKLNLNDRKSAEALNDELLKKNPKDAIAHMVRGRLFLADGDVDKAMLEFNETKKYQLDLPSLHYWYAQAYLRRGELAHAQQELQSAVQYDPNYEAARRSLAELENRTGAFDGALSNARRLLQSNPGDVGAMLIYSQALISKKNYTDADKVLKLVVERAPGTAELHRQLGLLALIRNDLPEAGRQFERAWELDPQSKLLLEGTLRVYLAERQPDTAIAFLQQEIERYPKDGLLYHQLAQVLLLEKKRPQAISALKTALGLNPGMPDSSILLASEYAFDGQVQDASQVLQDSLRQNPGDASLWLRAGMIFEKLSLWTDARKAYEHVLQLDPDNAIAKNNMAWLIVEHGGNIDVALNLAQQAEEKLGDNSEITNTIGWVYYQKGVYKTAWQYLKESAEKDQQNAVFQYHLAMACLKLGKREEARQALVNALKLDPHFQQALEARQLLTRL